MRISDWSSDVCSSDLPPPDTAAPRQRCIIDAEACMHGSGLELALVVLLAAVIAVPVFKKLGLGAVLAYLAAGVVLGPDGFGLVRDTDRILDAAEIGVVMLLFVIGLELSPARLRVMRRPVFVSGGLQVLLSALALAAIADRKGSARVCT